jgi:PAS domain S-box-containing protein
MFAQDEPMKFPRYLIVVFIILSIGIITTGYLYYKNQETYLNKEKQQQLASIITLKIDQIISWRQERIDYAGTVMEDPFLAGQIRNYLKGKTKPAVRAKIIERLTAVASYQYQGLALIDPLGNVRLSAPESREEITPYLKALAIQAMQTKKVVFSDLYRDENAKVRLSVLTPLLALKGNDQVVIGVISMQIEPYQFLYPLIKSWPTPSLTGETELIRREGNEVVFLNELRHRHNLPLDLRLPLNSPNLVAALVAQGKKGFMEGLDYRGVPVLAAVGAIPDSPWFLIAKIDAEEVYAPLRKRIREVIFLLFSLITSAGICVAYFWRNQQTRFYRRQYEVEKARRALAQRYEYLTRFANDIILVTDQDLKILEANNQAAASYGYPREELLNLHFTDLYPPGSKPVLHEIIRNAEEKSGLIFEADQRRRDGTTFPVEVSLRLLEVEGQRLFQGIIRDITERKQSQEALQRSEKNLRYLTTQLLRAQEDERKRISRELHDELGHALLALKLQLESVAEQLSPQQALLKKEMGKILGFMGTTIEGVRRLYLDLSPGDLEDLGLTDALHSLVDDFANLQKQIKWTVNLDHLDGLFPLSTQTAIYRVVQEALTNIGKHAKPKQVFIEVKRAEKEVSFIIKDNGIGFEPHRVITEKKTLGLLTMEERVKILGGSFELWSQENRGTRVAFTIPIPPGD